MIRRPPRSTLSSSSAASDVYKRQHLMRTPPPIYSLSLVEALPVEHHARWLPQREIKGKEQKAYMSWLQKHGARFDSVVPALCSHRLYLDPSSQNQPIGRSGLVLADDMLGGEVIINIPPKMALSAAAARASEVGRLITHLPVETALSVHLMYESGDPNSAYREYLDTLPDVSPSLCSWLDSPAGEALQGFAVHKHAARLRSIRHKLYAEHVEPLVQEHPELFGTECGENRFQWANEIRRSRSAGPLETSQSQGSHDRLTMVPVMDLVWHRPGSGLGAAQNNVLCCHGPGKSGSVICMDMGEMDNDTLLLKFGYTLLGNPHDSVEIKLSLDDMHPATDTKRRFLQETSLLNSQQRGVDTVSYTHLTLPTKRIV
eukprot:TRINITY_DN3639_c0_g1_i2.p1 TRINITY_DN3639_c0_g1~~TRINITY_DN3639_c0_g1_i2.p1  ORF type:complete len:373 (-),score=79.17 TRINITY_DN3639_c0_g1_i2:135-1253(-)